MVRLHTGYFKNAERYGNPDYLLNIRMKRQSRRITIDLKHPVGKVYKHNHRHNDNINTEVI